MDLIHKCCVLFKLNWKSLNLLFFMQVSPHVHVNHNHLILLFLLTINLIFLFAFQHRSTNFAEYWSLLVLIVLNVVEIIILQVPP